MEKRLLLIAAAVPLLVAAWVEGERDEEPRFRTDFYADVSLAERSSAMGATDPSWSPDGREIAFSLFGSIWRLPAAGGEARQVTFRPGYDAGAAWSPDGRTVAFLRGSRPIFGIQLGTQGRLTLVDPASGEERQLTPEVEYTGTPAWTPDGASLIVSRAQGSDVYLVQVPVTGGAAFRLTGAVNSRITTTMQRGPAWYYYWYPAAVHPGGKEVVFGGDRDGAPQLWRMPLGGGPIVTRKLTRYVEKDQAEIQDLSWDGAEALVYSANLTNDRTNFDLWRWNGKTARRMTTSLYDEFSPRVSPDRKTVLFVSNYLGNPDLFTAGPDLRQARHLPIRGLRFHLPAAEVRVRLRDETGAGVPARVSLRGGDGKYYAPPGALMRYHAGMGESAGFFHARGGFSVSVPAGDVRVAAFRGPEREPAVSVTTVRPGQTAAIELTLKRTAHWQGAGWWSGEDHIHANYAGPYYLRPEDALAMAEAEDLNVSNMLAANAEGERIYDREFFLGKPSPLSTRTHILYWNEEYRNRIVYGHMALLNLTRLIPPVYTSFEGTPHPWDYPSNTMVAEQARKANAVVDYVHPFVGMSRDPFDGTVSAKELPVTAALGLVDVVDVYPWGGLALDLWYRLLNCGLRIAPGAGTDTFSNWRSLNQIPGSSRVYVHTRGPLSYSAWIAGLRQGRSFVTNGPLLELEVNGKGPGDVLRSRAGEPLRVEVAARAESRVALRRMELIVNGAVVAARESAGGHSLSLAWKQKFDRSGWMALRVSGDADDFPLGAGAQAHTAPVYFETGGEPMRADPEAAAFFTGWIDRLWDLVEMRNRFEKPGHKEQVRALLMKARSFYAGRR